MTSFAQENTKPIPWQRIDYVFKLLDFYYPDTYLPFWLQLFQIQYRRIQDLPSEIQLPEQILSNTPSKFTVDLLQAGEAIFWDSETVRSVVAFVEFMHYNPKDYIDRIDLLRKLFKYKYKSEFVVPLVLYTGHEKCRLAKTSKDYFGQFRCPVLDITRLNPQITMGHPLFPIKFMTIFSHRLSQPKLADFFIREFEVLRSKVSSEEFNRFAVFIQLATTPRNPMAVQKIYTHLFANKPVEFYHELLKDTPLYEDLMRFHNEEKERSAAQIAEAQKARIAAEKARAEAQKARIAAEKAKIAAEKARVEAETKAQLAAEKARVEAETKAQFAAQKARIDDAVRFIQDFGLAVAQVAHTLGLTEDEIAAVQAALKE
jgi:hypothetical protein